MSATARPVGLLILSTVVLGASTVLLGRAVRADLASEQECSRLASLRSEAAEVASLHAAAEQVRRDLESSSPRLATACGGVLAAAGLPASVLVSLSPEAASAERVETIAVARARATLTLAPVTLPQLGRFLDAWRQRLPGWTATRIDLEPRRESAPAAPQPAPGSDLPLRIVMTVETTRWSTTESAP